MAISTAKKSIVAMVPATSLGAATPVGIGMPGIPGQQPPNRTDRMAVMARVILLMAIIMRELSG